MRNDTFFFRTRPTQVLVVPTELRPVAVPDFVRRIRAAFATGGPKHLVVDLSSPSWVDPEVFRLLQWAHGGARPAAPLCSGPGNRRDDLIRPFCSLLTVGPKPRSIAWLPPDPG